MTNTASLTYEIYFKIFRFRILYLFANKQKFEIVFELMINSDFTKKRTLKEI